MTTSVSLPALAEPVTKTFDVGLEFFADTDQRKNSVRKEANTILKELQQEAFSKITPVAVQKTLELLRIQPKLHGVSGASKIAKELADRENIRQVSYAKLLTNCQTTIKTETKALFIIQLLQEYPQEASSWLAYGRQPYLELLAAKYFNVQFRYARNLLYGFRRRLDTYLPPQCQLPQIIPVVTIQDIEQSLHDHATTIQTKFTNLPELTKRQKQYRRKVLIVEQHKDDIIPFIITYLQNKWYQPANPDTRPRSFWRSLRQLSNELRKYIVTILQIKTFTAQQSYLSVLRSIIGGALDHYLRSTVQNLLTSGTISVEHMVTPPFEKRRLKNTFYHSIPLHLVMGSMYVIKRSGNGKQLTQDAVTQGYTTVLIKPNSKKIRWLNAIPCNVMIHKKLQEYLSKGAVITSLIFSAGTAPSYKPRCQVIMEGEYGMFVSTRRILAYKEKLQQLYKQPVTSSILGLDVNRISEYLVAYSEAVPLPQELVALCKHYLVLGDQIKKQSQLVTRADTNRHHSATPNNQQKYCKALTELQSIQSKRKRLRTEIHYYCSFITSSALLAFTSDYLAVELLDVSTDHIRGSLAKAVSSMPDDLDLYIRAVVVAQTLTTKKLTLVTVDPYKTSQSEHIGCSHIPVGKPIRTAQQYDVARCSACNKFINTHTLAAQHISFRCKKFLHPIP